MTDTALIQNIKSLMAKRGMKQAALAQALGVAPSTVSAWMSGRIFPSMNVIGRICSVFGISYGQLMDYNETVPAKGTPAQLELAAMLMKDEQLAHRVWLFVKYGDKYIQELVKLYGGVQ